MSGARDEFGLTLKQRKFADKWLQCGNATQAYIYAYDTTRQRGERSVHTDAKKYLAKPAVSAYVEMRRREMNEKAYADMDEVNQFWADVLRKNEDKLRDVCDIKDRLKASEFIAKTKAAFIDRTETSGDVNFNINLKGSKKK